MRSVELVVLLIAVAEKLIPVVAATAVNAGTVAGTVSVFTAPPLDGAYSDGFYSNGVKLSAYTNYDAVSAKDDFIFYYYEY